ncbi:MAG: hypothetical protein LBT89_04095 [Planctomycetaceae bacterium]|jgi:hypothetical protein|nr:hypothetical protein [Planctomycetaceae bacterium]
MIIKNIEGMSAKELNQELEKGGKFVIFQYCVSVLVLTFKRGSHIYFIRSGESGFQYGIGCTVTTLLFGWWGFPWGPIYSIASLITNFRGGKDVTQEVIAALNRSTN